MLEGLFGTHLNAKVQPLYYILILNANEMLKKIINATCQFEKIMYICYDIIGQLATACYWLYLFQVNFTKNISLRGK